MNNNYIIGKSYELEYVSTIEIKDRKYLCVTDGEKDYTVVPYDFQLDWPDQISDTILCFVKDITPSGKPLFVQDRHAVLKNRYPHIGEIYTFFIKDICTETDGSIRGYILSDAFGITHYIPGGNITEKYIIGESVGFRVKDIIRKVDNSSNLQLFPAKASFTAPTKAIHKKAYTGVDVLDLEEGNEVEFKTSIVYLAGTSEPDIDGQGKIIMQTIAGFMNNNGGKLFIGVNDNGEIVGFNNDIDILFPNDNVKIHDKYELAIRNRINTTLGPIPNTKVAISFVKGENSGIEYCLIDVKKSDEPVFAAGYHLFVRAGNMTVHLKENHIISFIIQRLGLSYVVKPSTVPEIAVDPIRNAPESKTTDIEEIPAEVSTIKRSTKKSTIKVHNLADEEKIIGHLYFLKGGACRYVSTANESKPNGIPDYVFRTPVPSSPKNYNLLIFYSHGDTDIVNIEKALFGTGKNSGKKKDGDITPGWNTNLKILDAFFIKKKPQNPNMIAYVSTWNGKRYLKIHEMSAIAKNPHQNFGGKGNTMLSKGADLLYAIPVSGDVNTKRLLDQKALIRPDSYKSLCGTPVEQIQGQYLDILKPLFDAFDEVPNTIPATPVTSAETTETTNVQQRSTWMYILSESGNILKTMKGGEGSAVSNIPPTYDSIADLCKRHYPEMNDEKLYFVKFSCRDAVFNKELAKDVISLVFFKNAKFLISGKDSEYKGATIAEIAKECNTSEEFVINIVANGYIQTTKTQYPLFDPSDLAMVTKTLN